jgi:hypothetical protein
MKVSIETVIKAIETEPHLVPGQFISKADNQPARTPCLVCAVGAVLRSAAPEKATRLDVDIMARLNCYTEESIVTGDPLESVGRGDWLIALSQFFEQAETENRRETTIEFVRTHFPDTIEIELSSRLEEHEG